MRIIKVLVHCADYTPKASNKQTCRAEKVARFGSSQKEIQAYEPYADEEVTVALRFVDWWDNTVVHPSYIADDTLRFCLEKINLFPL